MKEGEGGLVVGGLCEHGDHSGYGDSIPFL